MDLATTPEFTLCRSNVCHVGLWPRRMFCYFFEMFFLVIYLFDEIEAVLISAICSLFGWIFGLRKQYIKIYAGSSSGGSHLLVQ